LYLVGFTLYVYVPFVALVFSVFITCKENLNNF